MPRRHAATAYGEQTHHVERRIGLSPPSDCATLERAKRLVNEAMFTVALQHRRLQSSEPEDKTFVFRRWADFQFMIVSLTRLRRAAVIATQVPDIGHEESPAIEAFDRTLPDLTLMRNIGEHMDEYALDSPDRHNKRVSRRQLEVGSALGWEVAK